MNDYLEDCRELIREEIREFIPRGRARPLLYDLMLDYPMRAAKALRPALCIAACRALGGRLEEVLRSAAVLELFHNAFLVHDDIEDGSLLRRGLPTLHQTYGIPIAINVGDGMLALSLQPLLDNTRLLGLGRALQVMQVIARMCRESVEGQALELDWIHRGTWEVQDRDYLLMVYKKTCWYTFIAPVLVGGLIAGVEPHLLRMLRRFAAFVGIAFQIKDDLLNLEAVGDAYGKEAAGDLEEGKRTLILLHLMRTLTGAEREHAQALLARERSAKRPEDIIWLLERIRRERSLEHARRIAESYAHKAQRSLQRARTQLSPSPHLDFMDSLVGFVIQRDR